MRVELVDGRVQRHGADHVRRARLLPVGRVGPHHLVEVDQVDGAAAGEERVAVGERRPGARRARRRRTGRTSCGRSTPGSRRRRAGAGGGASWAASTSTGTPRSWAAAMISSSGGSQPVTLEAPVTASSGGRGPSSRAAVTSSTSKVPSTRHSTKRRRHRPGPRQQVGVVLDHGRHDHVVGREPEPVGQVVDGLGGVAADDGDVVALRVAPGERAVPPPGPARRRPWPGGTRSPRPGGRSSTRAGTSVTRRATAGRAAGRRGGVEVQVRPLDAVDAGHGARRRPPGWRAGGGLFTAVSLPAEPADGGRRGGDGPGHQHEPRPPRRCRPRR